jgi:hypothetical protein
MAYNLIRRFCLFCCAIATVLPAIAGKITGAITDEFGDALPYANVLVKGTSMGTSANAQGYYSLTLPDGQYQIVAQSIGYKQSIYAFELKGNATLKHDITLTVQGFELKDFVIKRGTEDPAYGIIRKVIKRRQFHLDQLQSFQTSIYLKGVLRNRFTPNKVMGIKLKEENKNEMNSSLGLDSAGKGILYLCEELADYYAQGKRKKTIVRSVKESGNPNGVGLGSVPSVVNFYENNVRVLVANGANAQGFISPISQSALNYYTYKLEGNFQENGQTIFKIKVTPKRTFERCFIGDLYIADEDWAIHSLQLLLTNKQGLDLFDTIKTEQVYVPLSKDLWVIKSQVIYPTINFLGFDVAGNFLTVYDNQKINQQIQDSIFNNRIRVSYNNNASKQDEQYWKEQRLLTLAPDELNNYNYRDSIHKLEIDPLRIDSLRKHYNHIKVSSLIISGASLYSKAYTSSLSFSPILFDVNFNTVEGWNYAPTITWKHRFDTGQTIQITNNLRYGFSNQHVQAKVNMSYTLADRYWQKKKWQWAATFGKYISQFNPEQPVGELINTYSSLVDQRNYFKIVERYIAACSVQRNYGNGFEWSLSAQYEHRLGLSNTSDFSFVRHSDKEPYTENIALELAQPIMPEHRAAIINASVSYQPGMHYVLFPDKKVSYATNRPRFTLTYQKGISGIGNSSTDFDKWSLQIVHQFNMKRMGSLAINTSFGGFTNTANVPIPDMNHLLVNQYTIGAPYLQSFQLPPYYRFSNTATCYNKTHIEYYLKGILTNKIPLLRQAHLYCIIGSNTFYAGQNLYYNELFVGIDNIGYKLFRIFRFDYVYGWDNVQRSYNGFRIGVNTSNIKVNLLSTKASVF